MKKAAAKSAKTSSSSVTDWRVGTLNKVRELILEAYPEIVEERKWAKKSNPDGVPVWSHSGIVCTGEMYKDVVKLTFAKGASLPDPTGLFNSSLEGNTRRAIDIREGESVSPKAFQALIKAAVDANLQTVKAKASPMQRTKAKPKLQPNEQGVVLLTGGNPQIAKGDGDGPVQAYIAGMPGWKHDIGKRLDGLIEEVVPSVCKCVKWNSPFYGVQGQGWFLNMHCFTKYVKVTFFKGTSLKPMPPGSTPKTQEARWLDVYEDDDLDEAQLSRWIKQAAAIPGWMT